MKKLNTLLLLGAVSMSGLATAVADESGAIGVLNNKWDAAMSKGNTAELVSLYADNAVVMPPSSEILSSANAIKGYWDALRAVGVNDFVVRTVDVRIEGDKAYQTALWEATRGTDGNAIRFDGNMSNVLEREPDGTWKIKLQSWN